MKRFCSHCSRDDSIQSNVDLADNHLIAETVVSDETTFAVAFTAV